MSVPVARFEHGEFPMVCATSGRAADVRLGVRFRGRRGAPAVNGLLPFSSRAQRRLRLLVRIRYTVLAAGFAVLAALCLLGQWAAARRAGVPIAAVAFALNVAGAWRSIDGRVDATATFVQLRGVHPRFVAAVLDARPPG